MPKTTTLQEINDMLREGELIEGANPRDRLTCLIALLRSGLQNEIATDEGIAASLGEFHRQYGSFDQTAVDSFFDGISESLRNTPIPVRLVYAVLEAD